MKRLCCLALCAVLILSVFTAAFGAQDIERDFIMLEAEDDSAIITQGFERIADDKASGGAALHATLVNTSLTGTVPSPPLSYSINVQTAGIYTLYFRCTTFDAASDSIYFSVNTGGYQSVFASGTEGNYTWKSFKIKLEQGENTINFHYRKRNFRLDKIIVTNEIMYYPVGEGQPPTDAWAPIDYNKEQVLYSSLPLPSYIPPREHPRVIVRSNDILKIRKNLYHEQNSKTYQVVLNASNYDASECDLPPVPEGDIIAVNYSVRGLAYIQSNAFLYLINNDKERGRRATEGILTYFKTLDIANYSSMNAARKGGLVLYVAAQVYDWCYDLLTEAEKREIILAGITLMGYFEYSWPPVDIKPYVNGHESEYEFMKNNLAFGIAIYDEFPMVYNIIAGKVLNEFVPLKNYYYDNGKFNSQGTNYTGFRFTAECYMTILLDKIGARVVSENQKGFLYGSLYTRLPNGGFFRSGDDNYYTESFYTGAGPGMFLLGNIFKDPYLKQEFFRIYPGGATVGWADYTVSPVDHLIINDVTVEPKPIEQLPLTAYLGDHMGTMVAKTGWDEGLDSNAMSVFMRIPENFFKGHQHYDSGQFQIYYKGITAPKSGIYSYFGGEHDYGYNKQSIAANCMLIHNPDNDKFYSGNYPLMGGQKMDMTLFKQDTLENLKSTSKIGTILGYDYGEDLNTPSYSYLKGDLTGAYDKNAKKYTRAFTFLNFFDDVYPGALIVFDKVTSAKSEFKKTWLLHMEQEPEIDLNITTAVNTDPDENGRMINETLLPKLPDLSIEKVGGEGKENLVGDVNMVGGAPGTVLTGWKYKWRIEVSPKELKDTDYFLNVIQVSDKRINPAPLTSLLIETTEGYVGVQIKDRIAFFSKDEFRTSNDLTVATSETAKGEFIFTVDGLREGKWNIIRDGQVIDTKEATAKGGVISFTADSGEYTLSYLSSKTSGKDYSILAGINQDITNKIYLKFKSIYNDFKAPVIIENATPYAPVEEFSRLFGAGYDFDDENDKIILSYMGKRLEIQDYILKGGVLYSSLNNLSEFLEYNYSYFDYANILSLTALRRLGKDLIVNSNDSNRIRVASAVSDGDATLANVLDENSDTLWNAEGENVFIIFELEGEETLKDIKVKWSQGNARKYFYEIHTSSDGGEYTPIFIGESSGTSNDFESTQFTPAKAKYVKMIFKGNTQNLFNVIFGVEFYKNTV